MSEHIHIECPVGTSANVWRVCLQVGRTFATEYIDKRPGQRHGTVYTWGAAGSEREAACWWTKAGTVRVRLYALEAAP